MSDQNRDFRNPDPTIAYPTRWTFKVIGKSEEVLRASVAEVLADRDYELALSRTSRTARYLSMSLELEVESEEVRQNLYEALGNHPEIVLAM